MLNESPQDMLQAGHSRMNLALFGKHPCWNDHMEDFGLVTPSLIEFKKRLYYEGISGCLDSGVWRQLPSDRRIETFDHELVWTGETGVIFATIWHSSDAGGRASYPMVAAAHFLTSQLPASLDPVFSALQEIKSLCQSATEKESLRTVQQNGTGLLIQAARSLVPLTTENWPSDERANFINHPGFSENATGFSRFFYALSEYQNLHPQSRESFCYRVHDGGAESESLLCWQVIVRSQLNSATTLLTVRCRTADYVDVMSGAFPSEEFSRLKSNANEVPLVTDIPYSVPEQLVEQSKMVIESFFDTPCLIPLIDGCGTDGPGETGLGSLLGRLFKKK